MVDPPPLDVRWSRRRDSNPEPAVYKTAALPVELRRRDGQGHTAEDPFRRREMIGRRGRMGQARGARWREGVAGAGPGVPRACPAPAHARPVPGSRLRHACTGQASGRGVVDRVHAAGSSISRATLARSRGGHPITGRLSPIRGAGAAGGSNELLPGGPDGKPAPWTQGALDLMVPAESEGRGTRRGARGSGVVRLSGALWR